MSAAVNIQQALIPGVSPLGTNPRSEGVSGNPKEFGATFEKLLSQLTSNNKKAEEEQNSGPLQLLNQLLQMGGAGAQNGLAALQNLGGLRSETQQLQSQFEAGFKQMMSEQGLDLRSGVSLQADAEGEIRVSNDHPDKLFIEAALKNNPELTDLFRKLSDKSTLLYSSEMAQKIKQGQTIDPRQALAQSEQQFGNKIQQLFSLTITNDGAQKAFTSPPSNVADSI